MLHILVWLVCVYCKNNLPTIDSEILQANVAAQMGETLDAYELYISERHELEESNMKIWRADGSRKD